MLNKDKINLLIVDDHPLVQTAIKAFIQNCEDICLLGEANSAEKCLKLCEKMMPDVILMDIFLPEMDGIKATAQILKKWPHVKIIMLTSFVNSELIQNALKAGASGYFLKNASGKSIIKGIRDACEGKVTFSPEASRIMVEEIKDPLAKRFQLTRQEKNILNLMVEGLSNKDIAKRLYLSTSTVQFHITNILSKLGVTKRTEAVYLALKNNLVKFPIPDH